MDDKSIRMECLKLAVQLVCEAERADPVESGALARRIAEQLFGFVIGRAEKV